MSETRKDVVMRTKRQGKKDPDEIQEQLVQKAYVHHDHGGHDHNRDWDEWRKDERQTKQRKKAEHIIRLEKR